MGALLTAVFGWLMRTVILKVFVFAVLFYVSTEFSQYLITKLATYDSNNFDSLFANFTPAMWYFFEFGALDIGLPMIFSAAVTAFCIRRLPIIG